MSLTWILVLVFAAIALLVYSATIMVHDVFRYRVLVRERVDGLSGAGKGDANASLFKDLKQFDADLSRARMHWRKRLESMLEQANLRISLPMLAFISAAGGITLAVLAFLVSKHWWLPPVALAAGAWRPGGT